VGNKSTFLHVILTQHYTEMNNKQSKQRLRVEAMSLCFAI